MNLTHKKGIPKMLLSFAIVLAGCLIHLSPASAERTNNRDPNVLVVYSTPSGEIEEQERMLDMLIGHFTTNISFKSIAEVRKEDVNNASYLFYYGKKKEQLPETFRNILNAFEGTVVAFGHNVEQLGTRFSFVAPVNEDIFSKITVVDETKKVLNVYPQVVLNVNVTKDSKIIVKGSDGPNKEFPLVIKNNNSYYYAAESIYHPLSILLGEILHEIFNAPHENSLTGYIRLEDVSPEEDPKNLKEIAEQLKARNIPYMVAVIPVYTNPKTNKVHHLSDSPQLLKVLKYMQDNGGSIVLHGYTHQFRNSETGEGFEFWDVEHNMPIYHEPNEKVVKKTERDFETKQDYDQYREDQLQFETDFIDKKLNRGIEELANYGIYPLAFEAPHYTMSQNGYAVTSHYFSTYVGQIQISDKDWKIMASAPYITRPSFLNGMQLLPETIGYVEPNVTNAIEKMIKSAKDYSFVRDGMIAGFYHPHLGTARFIELLDELEKIPGIEWIDLKEEANSVHSQYVEIKTTAGEMTVDINRKGLFSSSLDFVVFHVKEFVTHITWGMVGAGSLSVLLFIIYTFFVRFRRGRYG